MSKEISRKTSQDLNSSADSIDLQLYHCPDNQIASIVDYLRGLKLDFCTDPLRKQDDYYSKAKENIEIFKLNQDNQYYNTNFGLYKNKFYKRIQSNHQKKVDEK